MTAECKRQTNKNNDNIKINQHKKDKVQGRRLCQFVVTIPTEFEWRGQEQAKLQLTINRTEHSITWVARRLKVGRMKCTHEINNCSLVLRVLSFSEGKRENPENQVETRAINV